MPKIPATLLLLTLSLASTCYPTFAAPASAIPVDLQIPVPPSPVNVDGDTHLLYELHLSNLSSQPFEISHLDVVDRAGSKTPLAHYQGATLVPLLKNPGAKEEASTMIGAGSHLIAFLDITIKAGDPVPTQLQHHLAFTLKRPDGTSSERELDGASVAIHAPATLVLQAPVRGEGWLAYDLMNPAADSHRQTLMAVNGHASIAQRFAIDWVRLGPEGCIYHDKATENRNWYDYGAEVLAVADGVISEVKDGIPENTATEAPVVPISIETIGGNYIALDLGNHHYAFYAHLQPGSVRVKVGDHVKVGQVLALLGNTGQSDGPHLHFQVTDGPDILASEGVPYVFDAFKLQGVVSEPEKVVDKGEAWQRPANSVVRKHERELPVNMGVITF